MIRWIALAVVLLVSGSAFATTLKSFQHNRAGVKHMEKKEYLPAYREFMKALEADPLNPELQLNMGLTFEANEELEKAEKTYRSVLGLVEPKSPLHFAALFNLAQVLGKQKKVDEALKNYQACLELEPESVEVKTNIELLFQDGQGGGQGDSKNKDKQQQQQGQNQNQQRDQKPDQPDEKQKPQPKSFQSQDLSKDDVKRILDEIKNQEQGIRAQEYDKNAKEVPKGKDW